MRRWVSAAILLCLAPVGWAQVFVSGDWDFTLQILPALKVYESELTLKLSLAGFEIESESTFYHDGLRYQSFDLSGSFGPFDVSGRISFHAQEVRYRKAWLTVDTDLGEGAIHLSANHWSAPGEYTSSDKDKFGPWPCSNAISWDEAWRHIGRTLYVEGPVVGYEHAGHLRIYVGRPSPDPNRFDVYISAANVPEFEEAFGARFWESWAGKTVCVQGTVKGYRWTSGGPRNGGYSVAEVAISTPSALSPGACCGYPATLACPSGVSRWFEAYLHDAEPRWIQGPVVSITGPATYYGYASHYRVRIGGGEAAANRVEVIMPTRPGWSTVPSSYSKEVCVYGRVSVTSGVAVILPPDLITTRDEPCCGAELLPGQFLNWRARLTWAPMTVTVDLGDCGPGTSFRRLAVDFAALPFPCCGLRLDASLALTKCGGFESLSLTLRDLPLGCCGLTASVEAVFTSDKKTLALLPSWPGGSGCLRVYGDVVWDGTAFGGIAVYGWGITCYSGRVKLRLVTALAPDAVEDMTDITFYKDEFEYFGITYTGEGCCGGSSTLAGELWFGTKGTLFGLQRVRLKLEVPVAPTVEVFAKGQWNFAQASPLEWFDLGWDISF